MPDTPAAHPRSSPRLLLAVLPVLLALGVWAWFGRRSDDAPTGGASSPYANTNPDVAYVGVAVCAECHPAQFETYSETPHSRAFRPVDPTQEPLPGIVDHELSGVRYEMALRDGQMRIRETVPRPSGEETLLTDWPVHFVVGSGESSLTYVTREDGFLLQSPTTWFTRPNQWAMSPGYDMPQHFGFARAIGRQCLSCHVGRIEVLADSDHRIEFKEDAIGCERCHGPGGDHVAFHRRDKLEPGVADPTIVVPTDLDRALAEDVCAQCHLDDTMVVERPGTDFEDWRPGLAAEGYRIHYGLKTPSPLMKVVGHMDQMRASRCYQESGTMTCLSCHDPHGRPRPEERAAFYRRACLQCHTEESCAMDGPHRRAEHADDSCIACHMPTVGTDIVHFAFTHHRVGHHGATEGKPRTPTKVDLVPKDDVSHLSDLERRRNLGMAYLRFAHRPAGDPLAPHLPKAPFFDSMRKARKYLGGVYADGARDPALLVSLAHLSFLPSVPGEPGAPRPQGDVASTLRYLDEAFALEARMPRASLLRALALKGKSLLKLRRAAAALPVLEDLTRMRREATDWTDLAEALWLLQRRKEAVAALEKALEIRPTDPKIHHQAARTYALMRREKKSAFHRDLGDHFVRVRAKAGPGPR